MRMQQLLLKVQDEGHNNDAAAAADDDVIPWSWHRPPGSVGAMHPNDLLLFVLSVLILILFFVE